MKSRYLIVLVLSLLGSAVTAPLAASAQPQHLVLLHGLVRSATAMENLAEAASDAGYQVCNIDYPARQHPVGELARQHVLPAIMDCIGDSGEPVAFITHSIGGIIVRQLETMDPPFTFGRVVMLAPPNQGTPVVDKLKGSALFKWIGGPAGAQLGTNPDSLANRLGPTGLELGIIAGTVSINPLFSWLIPGNDDGVVGVEQTPLKGMNDYIRVSATHALMMFDDESIHQALYFLEHGQFDKPADEAR
ncbi:esterase/lipase family protein [Pseudidiomarina sp.]|uniref:esterase/lipase family protein n=1 Tax=Pseudidiomarina sp. TaxID=2081707 RepID=UPI00299DFF9B|nr:alpha/beta fold hydrolase [Pseudidiomarina sp.]MDX1706175.1 alpha/beta fold hydrolase [Pseudidiomarina sp.]